MLTEIAICLGLKPTPKPTPRPDDFFIESVMLENYHLKRQLKAQGFHLKEIIKENARLTTRHKRNKTAWQYD